MDATWDVLFTHEFGKQFGKVPNTRTSKLEELFDRLSGDPFGQITQAKRLRSKSRLFRIRIGDWRLVYRVSKEFKRVILLRIAPRGSVYGPMPSDVLDGEPISSLPREPSAPASPDTTVQEPAASRPEQRQPDIPAEGEFVDHSGPALDEHELFLLGIPRRFWPAILELQDESDIASAGLPDAVRERIEDYVTAPGAGQIGKLYRLAPQQGLASIRSAPLSEFLLELDPDQKAVVGRPLDRGPYLIRGAPGTGKTLVALSRLHRIWRERASEELFDQGGEPWFGFVTFNRSLVQANEKLFERMLGGQSAPLIRFRTFDQVVSKMLTKHSNDSGQSSANPRIVQSRELEELLESALASYQKQNPDDSVARKLIAEHAVGFFEDEFEQVIRGNGIGGLDEYLSLARVGCGVRLGRRQRESVWAMFDHWNALLEEKELWTWEGKRLQLLRLLESGEMKIRKANAIVADEVQDLTPVAIRILVRIVKDVRFLTLSADAGQSIYHRAPSWKEITPELRFTAGNSFILRRSWRMTKQIDHAVAPLRSADEDDMKGAVPVVSGPPPAWRVRPESTHLELCRRFIKRCVEEREVNPGQIAVICRYHNQVRSVLDHLGEYGIRAALVDREAPLDAHDDCVRVMTVHAAKGIEFPFVIVPFVSDGVYPSRRAMKQSLTSDEVEETLARERKLLYVALSRASRFLFLISDTKSPSPFVADLQEEHWDKR